MKVTEIMYGRTVTEDYSNRRAEIRMEVDLTDNVEDVMAWAREMVSKALGVPAKYFSSDPYRHPFRHPIGHITEDGRLEIEEKSGGPVEHSDEGEADALADECKIESPF